MTYETEIEAVESEWAAEDGFFWRVRQGHFLLSDFERAMMKLSKITVGEASELPRRLVSLLWYIPLFMQWQVERVEEMKGDVSGYMTAIARMTNEIERILGVP